MDPSSYDPGDIGILLSIILLLLSLLLFLLLLLSTIQYYIDDVSYNRHYYHLL